MKAAIWIRVSSDDQVTANQLPALERMAAHHGYEVVRVYDVTGSAWKMDKDYVAALETAKREANQGMYDVLIIWALDRLTRGGAEITLRLIREFRERHVTILSANDSWLNTNNEINDAFVGFAATMARNESARRSLRVREGMARAKETGTKSGKPLGGRKPGSKDKKPRVRSAEYRAKLRAAALVREAARREAREGAA